MQSPMKRVVYLSTVKFFPPADNLLTSFSRGSFFSLIWSFQLYIHCIYVLCSIYGPPSLTTFISCDFIPFHLGFPCLFLYVNFVYFILPGLMSLGDLARTLL